MSKQAAAELRLLVDQHDPRAAAAGGERGGEPGGATAHDQHVAVRMTVS